MDGSGHTSSCSPSMGGGGGGGERGVHTGITSTATGTCSLLHYRNNDSLIHPSYCYLSSLSNSVAHELSIPIQPTPHTYCVHVTMCGYCVSLGIGYHNNTLLIICQNDNLAQAYPRLSTTISNIFLTATCSSPQQVAKMI